MIKKIILVVLVILAGYGLLNAPYLWKQAKFQFSRSPQPTFNNEARPKMEPNQISIPSLEISAPLIESKESNENAFQTALQDGIVHYPGTAGAGEAGNAYFFGHSSDFAFAKGNYKTVFALLPSVKVGDEIFISNSGGDQFKYIVLEGRVINNDDLSVLDQNTNGEKRLTLQTSYPVGTALKRYIVVSKLVE